MCALAASSASPSCFAVISARLCAAEVWRRRAVVSSAYPAVDCSWRVTPDCADSERDSAAESALA